MSNELAPAPQKQPVTKLDRFKTAMKSASIQEQMTNALKENKDAFIASMIDLVSGDSKLAQSEPGVLIGEALKAAVLKLPVIKSLGFAWIIPYKKSKKNAQGQWEEYYVPTFQIGYKGYIQLAIRSGHYKHINARVVYEGQLLDEDFLTGGIKFQSEKTSDKIIGYMAHIELLNGFSKTLYSTKEEIAEHAKRYSKSYDPSKKDNIWVAEFDAMALKTQIRELLSKWGILSTEMQSAIAQDFESDRKNFVDENGTIRSDDANSENAGFDTANVVDSKITKDEETPPQDPVEDKSSGQEEEEDKPDF